VRSRRPSPGPRAPGERRYWALFGNPAIYRIQDAVWHRHTDLWTSKGRDLRAGDRVLIWKGLGEDRVRGVVALGEVETDPALQSDGGNRFWVNPDDAAVEEERVLVRYVRAPGLPLWLDGPADLVLRDLSVCRASGGTVFRVPPEQWAALLEILGGWPEAGDEPVAIGQGDQADRAPAEAVERHAMAVAEAHYGALGWSVSNVSRWECFDLLCTREGGEELHVEVKGTESDGGHVLVTANEVEHARGCSDAALFVVGRIAVEGGSASGGNVVYAGPWALDDARLRPVTYSYAVGAAERARSA
jgi:hypothetical protein